MRRCSHKLSSVIFAKRGMVAASSYVAARDIPVKSGNVFKAGERMTVKKYVKNNSVWFLVLESSDGRDIALSVSSCGRYLKGFPKEPSISALERWSEAGVSKAIDGSRVEPDGIAPSGAPSWNLVLGII